MWIPGVCAPIGFPAIPSEFTRSLAEAARSCEFPGALGAASNFPGGWGHVIKISPILHSGFRCSQPSLIGFRAILRSINPDILATYPLNYDARALFAQPLAAAQVGCKVRRTSERKRRFFLPSRSTPRQIQT